MGELNQKPETLMASHFIFLHFMILLIFVLLLIFSLTPITASGEDEESLSLSRGGVTPSSGDSETTFLFLVTITSSNTPDFPVEVVINNVSHRMYEVDYRDTNYSDGKDFEYRDRFEVGGVVYYFRCGNVTTPASTISVSKTKLIEWHIDIAIISGIFVIPVIYTAHILKRLLQGVGELTARMAGIEEEITKRFLRKEEQPETNAEAEQLPENLDR